MKLTYLKMLIAFYTMLIMAIASAETSHRLKPNYLFDDFDNMFEELDEAANKNDAQAQMTLGLFYFSGVTSSDGSVSIPKDIEMGKAWFMRAIESGNVCAMGVLAMEYVDGKNLPRDDMEVDFWLRKAIEKGGPEAKIAMLERLETGVSTPTDDRELTRLILASAAYGHPHSQVKAAELFIEGQHVAPDIGKAYYWIALAVKAEPHNSFWVARRDEIAEQLSRGQLMVENAKINQWQPQGRSECEYPKITFKFYQLN